MLLISRIRGSLSGKSSRLITLIIGSIIILAISVCNITYSLSRPVTIIDDGKTLYSGKTFSTTVDGLLKRKNITLKIGDKISTEQNTVIADNMTIEIYRAMPITIVAKEGASEYLTTKRYPVDILCELGYNATAEDIITPDVNEAVTPNSLITFIKTAEEVVKERFEIPFSTKKKDNNSLENGKEKISQEGKNGIKEVEYKIYYHDGVEVSRDVIGEEIIAQAVTEVKEIGTKGVEMNYQVAGQGFIQTSRSGELKYSKVIAVNASAYDLSYASTGKSPGDRGYGVTATGMRAQRGVIAVDPNVIPLYSKLYIEAPDGSWVYGTAVAGDTGGAIKGNKIDLFFDTAEECRRFGRRQAKVYILE